MPLGGSKTNQDGLKLNGTHRLLAYVDDINIVGENIDIVQKNTNAPLDASKDIDLEVNPEKTEYMLMSCYQKAGQKLSLKIASRSFEDVARIKYFGATVTDQKCIWEGIKSRLNLGNACYHSVESLVFPPALWECKVEILQNHNSASCVVQV
jgi:hypothetical protein